MSAYSDRIAADGASHYWRLGDLAGVTAVDSIGPAHGTITGGVTLNQPGALSDGNGAMTFNGTTGQITVPNGAIAVGVGPVSMEAWIKTASDGWAIDPATNGDTTVAGIVLRVSGTQALAYVKPGSGGAAVLVFSGIAVADNVWHHIVGVVARAATDTVLLYVDGVLKGQAALPAHWNLSNTAPMYFGGWAGAGFWAGSLDDVAIYPRALSAAEITAHYTLGKIGKTQPSTYPDRVILDGATNYWRLGETSGTTAVDVVGGKHGTISGGVTLGQPGAMPSDGDPAMSFPGTDVAKITAPNLPFLNGATNVSVEVWAKLGSLTAPNGLRMTCQFGNLTDANYLAFDASAGGQVLASFFISGAQKTVRATWSDLLWHHFVVTYDGATLRNYIDGVAKNTTAATGALANAGNFVIGNWSILGYGWLGLLDDIAIYPRALTPADIAAHYTRGTAPASLAPRDYNTTLMSYLQGAL